MAKCTGKMTMASMKKKKPMKMAAGGAAKERLEQDYEPEVKRASKPKLKVKAKIVLKKKK